MNAPIRKTCRTFVRRLQRGSAALGLTLLASACGDSMTDPQQSPSSESRRGGDLLLPNDTVGVELSGGFERLDGRLGVSRHLLRSTQPLAQARFSSTVSREGFYEVLASWPQTVAAGNLARALISHRGGQTEMVVDQGASGGDWVSLGIYAFDGSAPAAVQLVQTGNSPLFVDALRLRYVGETRPELQVIADESPLADQDREFLWQVKGRGGAPSYSFRISEGALPPGLLLNPRTGVISGIPARIGRHEFTIEIADSEGTRAIKPVTLEVLETPDAPLEAPTGPMASKRQLAAASMQSLGEIVSALPEGEWAQVSLNSYSSVWTPADQRPLAGSRNPPPDAIIKAWSSFAWDSRRGRLILYGGGHANYRGNDVYIWDGATRTWTRGSLPSEMKRDPLGNWNAIDGHERAPASAHTYDNSEYLPIVDRFLTLGGAADSNGGHYLTQETETTSRRTGPYMFDPSRAHPDKAGGTTGSHVQRVSPYPEVVGGEMWANRENWLNSSKPPSNSFVKGCTAYAEEQGKDVLYARTQYGLFRYTIHDVHDRTQDTWQTVGRYWNGPSSQGPCGYDPVGKSFVRVATNAVPFVYWNLNTPGPKNNDVNVIPTDPTGEFEALLSASAIDLRYCGLDYDPIRKHYALWCGDGRVWALTPPATLSAAGWVITRQRTPVLEVPNGSVGTGILGKWKYVASLDAFVGLQDPVHGNIWIYKPVGWKGTTPTDPPPEDPDDPPPPPPPPPANVPPSVAILAPVEGSTFLGGQPITLAVQASDSDGSVARVEFFNGTTRIGEDLTAPFEIVWSNAPLGPASLTAIATDNSGASTVSAPVTVNVVTGGTAGTVVLQRGVNGYAGSADTYLSSYHKSLSFGSNSIMQDSKSYYSMMARFAIFQSEGGPIPDGATIQSARLAFYKYSSYNMVYGVHRVLKNWSEGTANWSQTGASGAWSEGGGNGSGTDYQATPDATASSSFDPGWIEFDVTASVQQMGGSTPTGNFGWRLRAISGYTSALKKFHTSEYGGSIDLRPKLTITYH